MALAQGSKYYVAPPLPRALASDLSLLPLWYSNADDVVLSADAVSSLWQKELRELLGVSSVYRCIKKGQNIIRLFPDIDKCCAWGWSAAIKTKLLSIGVSEDILPTDLQIGLQSQLSHRAVTIQIIDRLHRRGICREIVKPQQLESISEIKDFIGKYQHAVLKSPWSSSGKGICWCKQGFDKIVENWSKGVLARQKSVIAECYYDKQVDFAMEFSRSGKEVLFAGYSCFCTDERGAYHGTWLASNQDIECYLASYGDLDSLLLLKDEIRSILESLLEDLEYQGYFGVDMMIYKNKEKQEYFIHPCVELNLRMSMGMVARILFDRYIASGSQGYYFVDFCGDNGAQLNAHLKKIFDMPLRLKEGKNEEGYWALSPVFEHTKFRAYAEIFKSQELKPSRFFQSE